MGTNFLNNTYCRAERSRSLMDFSTSLEVTFRSIVFILLALFSFSSSLQAQKLSAQVSKTKVVTGEVFQITFSAGGAISSFNPPSFKDFEVYSGPNQSTSMQFVNGSMSQSMSFSYMIACKKEGKFTIPGASAVINGNKSESNPIAIEVVKGTPPQQQRQQNQNPFGSLFGDEDDPFAQQQQSQAQKQQSISPEDFFVKTYVSKKKCFIGEQIIVTQKLYCRFNPVGSTGLKSATKPAYDGFWSKDDPQNNAQVTTENLDGINYYVAEVAKTFLFPQRQGSLTIDPIELEYIVRVRAQPKNTIERYFGGGYQDIPVKIKSKPVSIDVSPLPETGKPESFAGAVGKFSFKTELNHDKVKANESINLKITVNGNGNISLAGAPKLNFPEGFETYEPKLSESINTSGGVSGTKTYDYLVIPRKEGEYILKDINFSYFDPEKKQYVSIPSPDLKITVTAPDPNSAGAQVYNPKHEVQTEENDIRYIKTGPLELKDADESFFGSVKHYAFLFLIVIAFIVFMAVRNVQQKNKANVVAVKERRAVKMARKQLAQAEKLKNENKQDAFYNEVLNALNLYISHKLNIAVADLSKENISQNLLRRNVSQPTVDKLINALHEAEYARYAPAAAEKDLNLVYNHTVQLITEVEEELGRKAGTGKTAMITLLFMLSALSSFSINLADTAATAYAKQNYKKAIDMYETLLAEGRTSYKLHYNLGNAYYKNNQIGKAIYQYELAKKMQPNDKDIQNNLVIANSKTIDKIDAKENMFAGAIKGNIFTLTSLNGWAWLSILSLLIVAGLFALYFSGTTFMLKRFGFLTGGLFMLIFFFCMSAGYAAKRELQNKSQAIILAPELKVHEAPDEKSKFKFTLHEGTKVNVLSLENDYAAIQLANGNEGFVKVKELGLF